MFGKGSTSRFPGESAEEGAGTSDGRPAVCYTKRGWILQRHSSCRKGREGRDGISGPHAFARGGVMLDVATPKTGNRAASLAGLERTVDGTLAMFVAGEWTGAAGGGRRPLVDPATDAILAYASEGTPADAERAIAAARRAFDDGPWPRYAALERALGVGGSA